MVELIISVFNRTELLRKNLLRFQYITIPDYITVVDDGTHDALEVKSMLKTLDFLKGRIQYIRHNNPDWDSCSIPKNIGLRNSRGDILIYTEPENIFVRDVVEASHKLPENKYSYQDWVYFGKQGSSPFPEERIKDPLDYIDEYGWYVWESGTEDVHGGQPTYTAAVMVSPWYFIVRKNDLLNIGGWDEQMSGKNGGGRWGFDDIDLITRLRESGINAMTMPISVIHQWHDRPPQWIQDSWGPNEKIMKEKQDEEGKYKREFIMANREKEWGSFDGYKELI